MKHPTRPQQRPKTFPTELVAVSCCHDFFLDGCNPIQGHGQNCGKPKLPNVGILTDLKRLEYLADAIDY